MWLLLVKKMVLGTRAANCPPNCACVSTNFRSTLYESLDQPIPGLNIKCMTRALHGPRASMGHVVSTTPPRTPTIHSCRLTVGSQWLGASCTVEPIGSRPAHVHMHMHMESWTWSHGHGHGHGHAHRVQCTPRVMHPVPHRGHASDLQPTNLLPYRGARR